LAEHHIAEALALHTNNEQLTVKFIADVILFPLFNLYNPTETPVSSINLVNPPHATNKNPTHPKTLTQIDQDL